MNFVYYLLISLAGYLIGSVSFARIVTKIVNPEVDLDQTRTHRSDTGEEGTISGIGAYTTSIALGGAYGGLVGLLDMLKAFIPVLILQIFYPEEIYGLLFSIFAILGHNFPIYYGFIGGRGLSTMLGSLLVLDPLGLVVALVLGMLISILINQPTTGLLLWMPTLAAWALLVRNDLGGAIYALLIMALFIIADLPELKTALQYREQDRLDEYNEMLYESAPMMRMIKDLSDKIRFWDQN